MHVQFMLRITAAGCDRGTRRAMVTALGVCAGAVNASDTAAVHAAANYLQPGQRAHRARRRHSAWQPVAHGRGGSA
jgi:gentisate 1,2-dioxygenase